jgi:thiol:disulfide interchange protein DsbD
MEWLSNFLSELLNPASGPGGHPGALQFLGALALAYFGGVLSSLTPCVYPMIPITISAMGGTASKDRSIQSHRWRDLAVRGIVYVSGMSVVYAFLGVLAGLTGKIFGTLTQSGGWYLALGVIYALGALVMLDLIPFDPMAWWDRLARPFKKPTDHAPSATARREVTLLGAFTLGASSGFIASPCTTPVLTAILAFIANTQSVGMGLALMLGFSLGIGTLLLAIALFTGAFQYLPRSGTWMERVKFFSGILLLAVSHYMVFRAGNLWQAR